MFNSDVIEFQKKMREWERMNIQKANCQETSKRRLIKDINSHI